MSFTFQSELQEQQKLHQESSNIKEEPAGTNTTASLPKESPPLLIPHSGQVLIPECTSSNINIEKITTLTPSSGLPSYASDRLTEAIPTMTPVTLVSEQGSSTKVSVHWFIIFIL